MPKIIQETELNSVELNRSLTLGVFSINIQIGRKKTIMKRTILFVDDSLSMRQVMSMAMKAEYFVVTTAFDGLDGVHKLDDCLYDVIISDVNMPNMDGIAFIKNVKEHTRNKFAKVIMLTTVCSEEIKEMGRDIGVNAWVEKPFRHEQLLAVINKLLRQV